METILLGIGLALVISIMAVVKALLHVAEAIKFLKHKPCTFEADAILTYADGTKHKVKI